MSNCGLQQPARRRLRVADLNPHLMCILCGGYYVDATTIIECLHSFCKSCLVRYLESNKYCPICEVQVHKTRPLQNIRPDETLQNMVYKLVPGLFQREMQMRQEFYSKHPDAPESSPFDRGVIDPIECQFYSPEEPVSLALEFKSQASTSEGTNGVYKRYLRCPAAVTIAHLQKLVRNKFGLTNQFDVDIMFLDRLLQPDLSIMDVAYAFQRKRKEQFHFTYRIIDTKCKKMRLDPPVDQGNASEPMEVDPAPSVAAVKVSTASHSPPESKSKLDSIISRLGMAKQTEEAIKKEKVQEEWKEVQLQISENGVMSVTDISSLDKLIDTVEKNISSVENSPNGKLDLILKSETSEKTGIDKVKQEKSKISTPPSVPQPKSEPSVLNGKDALNGSRADSEKKSSMHNGKKKDSKMLDTTLSVATPLSSEPASPCSLPKSFDTRSKPVNDSTVKGVPDCALSSSSNSLVFSVSNTAPSIKSTSATTDVSTVSVSAAKTPIASASVDSGLSKILPSTKATPSSTPSVSTPLVLSHPVMCASTVSVSSVSTPAVSARSTSTPAAKEVSPSLSITTAGAANSSPSVKSSAAFEGNTSASSAAASVSSASPASGSSTKPSTTSASRVAPASAKKSSSSPVGYKTLKCGPKTWNPTISRNSFLSSKMEQQQQPQQPQQHSQQQQREDNASPAPGKQATPPRFFKMRNTPRYLGNPVSGVKAMYQVPDSQTQPPPAPAPPAPPAAPSPKAPSLMKLDPRTLTPIVSNASSSPTVKSPTSQSKGRPPFPSTTLSVQVNNHVASSRTVATTTTTTSSAMSGMRSFPSSAQAKAHAMANFLSSPFVPKGLPNFLYGTLPSLMPAGPAQFHNMLRPFHPVPVPMLYPHQMHRQLSVPPTSAPSPSPPAVQRVPASGEKPLPSPSYRSNRSAADATKVNGQQDGPIAAKPKTSPRPATEPPYSPTSSKSSSSLLCKESGRVPGGSTNDNNNTVPPSKVKAHFEKSEGEKLSHNISKLLPKAIAKHGESL